MAQIPGTNIMPSGGGSSEDEQESPESSPVPVVGDLVSNEDKPDDTRLNFSDEVGREDNEEETPPVEIGQGDNQEEESRPFVLTSPERERVRREANPPQSFLARFVEFCKQNRAAILIALVALATVVFPVWVGVDKSNTSVQQNNEIKSQNDEILLRLPDATTTQELDAYKTELDMAKEELAKCQDKNNQLEEKLLFINQTACVDLGSIGNPIAHCDFTRCVEVRLDGEEAFFHVPGNESRINYSETKHFPVDCLDVALTKFDCFSEKGRRAVKDWRKHPNCPGKIQYQCLSSGRNDSYPGHDFKRDVHATIITCPYWSDN